jgi:hypothetical protein
VDQTELKYRRLPVSSLSPAAARLLLALLTIAPNEPMDEALERSGIADTRTFLLARKQLAKHGFIVKRDGQEYFSLYAQEPQLAKLTDERFAYPGVTLITNARQ